MNVDNLIDEQELMHALMKKLTNIFLDTMRQYENLNLLNADSAYVHCASAASRELQKKTEGMEQVKASNVWNRIAKKEVENM